MLKALPMSSRQITSTAVTTEHTDLSAHDFAHSFPCDTSLGSLAGPMPGRGDFVEPFHLYVAITGNMADSSVTSAVLSDAGVGVEGHRT
jgi:hypothetical protein